MNRFNKILNKTPLWIKNYNRLSMGIAAKLDDILKSKNMSQKNLADLMNKKESEISKWLSGTHNFTIKSISKIEEKLGVAILETDYGKTVEHKKPSRSMIKTYMADRVSEKFEK